MVALPFFSLLLVTFSRFLLGGFKRGAERGAEGGQGGAEMEMELGAQKARRPGSPVWIDVVYTLGGLGPRR